MACEYRTYGASSGLWGHVLIMRYVYIPLLSCCGAVSRPFSSPAVVVAPSTLPCQDWRRLLFKNMDTLSNANSSSLCPSSISSPILNFTIGLSSLEVPFVRVEDLKAHLCLLRAFKDLRTKVELGNVADWSELVRNLSPESRWHWFVGLAIER